MLQIKMIPKLLLYSCVVSSIVVGAFSRGDEMPDTRLTTGELSTTRLAFRAASLEEVVDIWRNANGSARRRRLRQWLVADGLSLASRNEPDKYPLAVSLECDLTGILRGVSCGISFVPKDPRSQSKESSKSIDSTAGVDQLLQASMRRANKMFSQMSRVTAIELNIRRYETFTPHRYDGKPVIAIDVQGIQGADKTECSVILLLFVGERHDRMSSVLPSSKLKSLPCDSPNENLRLDDGYDSVLQFSNSVGTLK